MFLFFLLISPVWLLGGYTPGSLKNYRYRSVTYSSTGVIGWMRVLVQYYSGNPDDANGQEGVRRGVVPGTMVDQNGDLYFVGLSSFTHKGPEYYLQKYSINSSSDITYSVQPAGSGSYDLYPWIYGQTSDLYIDDNPSFWYEADWQWFGFGFHNTFEPCIAQEVDGSQDYIYRFHYIPSGRIVRNNSPYGYEGGLWMKCKKSNLILTTQARNLNWGANALNWCNVLRRRGPKFAYCTGNFQAFVYGSYFWFFNLWQWNENADQNSGICCTRYRCEDLAMSGVLGFQGQGSVGLNSSLQISPRFLKVGSYIYFFVGLNGYWFRLYRLLPNETSSDSVGTIECVVATGAMDCYIETTRYGHSWAPYGFDYCLLEEDGTPCSSSSSNSTRKILCVFSLGGGGSNSVCGGASYNWKQTYVSWTYDYVVGAIGSAYLTNGLDQDIRTKAYAQNRIYVTDFKRESGNFVDINDTSKTDLYRLYLNTHKMVPYTSPSGKHYLIYAYCYPGKKKYLYLGYAPYYIDSNHEVRLGTKFEFKKSGDSGWGETITGLDSCSRIHSMDLKNGHLWITYGISDDTSCRCFHIRVSDLIRE